MKVIMVAVASVDGKLTRGNDPKIFRWTSAQDQVFFSEMVAKSKLMVMGSRTYEAAKKNLKLKSGQLRIILTRQPEKYSADGVAGQLEFSHELPERLVERLAKQGKKEMLLLGGGEIYGQFLKLGLVDELYLTVEPRIFGSGRPLGGDDEMDVNLKLMDWKKLNSQGTILLHYQVLR